MAAAKQLRMLEPDARAPEFELSALDGGKRTLQQFLSSGPVLLAFFKITCPVCQFTLPYLERIFRGRAAGSLQFFGISQDDAESTREFNQRFGVSFPTLLDREEESYPASNAYGISHVPSMFLIEPDGRISWALDGWNKREIQTLGAKAGVNPFRQDENVPEWK